ncbi:MAG: TonB-dependent receptor [Segetibacter sp.]
MKDTLTGDLENVVVSVNKWEQKMNEIPNTILKVDLTEARLQNPQTAADLLATTGQIFVQKSQLGGGSPMIRGFSTNRLLIVVDGVRMNNAIYCSGNLQNIISIDALSVQNAEVIFGPGSIIYGSDAIGGVMDFHTFQPALSTGNKLMVRANGLVRYATANNEQTGHVDINLGWKKWAFLNSVSYSDFGNAKMGRNGGQPSYLRTTYVERINNRDSVFANPDPYRQKQSGYHQLNTLTRLRFKPSDVWDLQYAFHYSGTGNIPRYDRLIENTGDAPSFAQWYYGPQVWKMHQFMVQHNRLAKIYDQAKLIAAFQDYEESRYDRRLNNARIRNQTEKVNVFTVNLDLNKTLNEKSELFYGAEYVANDVGSFASRLNINNGTVEGASTRYPNNSTWNSLGAYVSYKNNFSRKITLSSGLRYSYVTGTAPFDTTFFKFPFTQTKISDGALTGNLGLVYRPTESWQINTNFSTGFRVPNIDDLGKVVDSEPGNVIVPNPGLHSEYAYNVDVSVNKNVRDKFRFDITAFYTYLDNAIIRRPSTFNGSDSIIYEGINSRVQSLQNAAYANVWGIQAGYEWFFVKHWSWALRANWINGKETDETRDEQVSLRHAPPFYGNTFIKYNNKRFVIELNAFYNGEVSSNNLAPSELSKPFIYAKDENGKPYSPSWYTLNVKGSYSFNDHLTMNAGIENITNQSYRPYSSGIVAFGTNLIISLRAGL